MEDHNRDIALGGRSRWAGSRGATVAGVLSVGTRVGAWRLWGAYWELRRLTMRGERLFSVLVASNLAPASSSSRNHRRPRLERPGGERPRSGAVRGVVVPGGP